MKFDSLYNAIISETRCVYNIEDFQKLIEECKKVPFGGWLKFNREELSQKISKMRKFGSWKFSDAILYFFRVEDDKSKALKSFKKMVDEEQKLSWAFKEKTRYGSTIDKEIEKILEKSLANSAYGECTPVKAGIYVITIPEKLGMLEPYSFEEVFCHEFTHFLQCVTGNGFSFDSPLKGKGYDKDGIPLTNGISKDYSMRETAGRTSDKNVKGMMTISKLASIGLLDLNDLLGIKSGSNLNSVFNSQETITYFNNFSHSIKRKGLFSSSDGLGKLDLNHFRSYMFKDLKSRYGLDKAAVDSIRKSTKSPLDMVNSLIRFRNKLVDEAGGDSSKIDLKPLTKYAVLVYPEVFSLFGNNVTLAPRAEIYAVLTSIALMQNIRFLKNVLSNF